MEVLAPDTVPDVCKCLICLEALVDPRVVPCCGQAFCLACITRCWEKQETTLCPHCKKEASLKALLEADRTLLRLLGDIVVNCEAPCEWRGPRGNLKEHLQRTCLFVQVPCPNVDKGCEKQLTRRDADAHSRTCFFGAGEPMMAKPHNLRRDLEIVQRQLREREAELLVLRQDIERRDRVWSRVKLVGYVAVAVLIAILALLRPKFSVSKKF